MILIARKNPLRALVSLLLLGVVLVASCLMITSTMNRFYRAAYPLGYQELVEAESARNDLPPALVYAVIRTESGFRPEVQSSVGARGLMQITQPTFEWAQYRIGEKDALHFDDLYQSELNIRYGAVILRLLLGELDSVENALCAYHAGLNRTQQWLDNPEYSSDGKRLQHIPYPDTRYYVNRVMETMDTYETLYDIG